MSLCYNDFPDFFEYTVRACTLNMYTFCRLNVLYWESTGKNLLRHISCPWELITVNKTVTGTIRPISTNSVVIHLTVGRHLHTVHEQHTWLCTCPEYIRIWMWLKTKCDSCAFCNFLWLFQSTRHKTAKQIPEFMAHVSPAPLLQLCMH